MPAPRSARRPRRRLLKVGAAGLLVWFLLASLPLPVGWLLRPALARSAAGTDLVTSLESATLRWRWGEAALRLELREVRTELRHVPFLTAQRIQIEVNKSALFERRVPPVSLLLEAPELTFDARASGRLTTLPPAATGQRAFVPASWERLVPRTGESFRVQLRQGRATVLTDAGPWQTGCAVANLVMGRQGDSATVTMKWISRDGDWHGGLDATANPHTGHIKFLVQTDPGVVRWPGLPPLEISVLTLRGGGEKFGRTWWCQLADATPQIAGVRLSEFRLETEFGPPLKIGWDFKFSLPPATLRDAIRSPVSIPPFARSAFDQVQEMSVQSSGHSVLLPGPDRGWRSRSLRALARIEVQRTTGETVEVAMAADQEANSDRIESSLTVNGLNPTHWQGPTSPDVSLVVEAHAGWSGAGAPLDGRLEVRALGPGRWRHELLGDLPVDELALRLRADVRAGKVNVETARLRAGAASLDLTESSAQRIADGTWSAQAVVNTAEIPAGAWCAQIPALAAKAHEAGLELDALAMRTAKVALSIEGLAPAKLLETRGYVEGTAQMAWGQTDFTVKASATRTAASSALDTRLAITGLHPSRIPVVGRPPWTALDLPIEVAVDARVDVSRQSILAAQLQLTAGAGMLVDPVTRGGFAISEAQVRASLSEGGRLRITNARLRSGVSPLWIQAEDVEIWPETTGWQVHGRIAWAEMRAADVWLVWPETVQPHWRMQARAWLQDGRIETGSLALKLRSGPEISGRQMVESVTGSLVLREVRLTLPAESGEVRADWMELLVNYPRAELRWERLHGASVTSSHGRLRLWAIDQLPQAEWAMELDIPTPPGPLVANGVNSLTSVASWLQGPISGQCTTERIDAATWRATAVFDLSQADCSVPAGLFLPTDAPLPSPAPLRVTVDATPSGADRLLTIALECDQLLGRPCNAAASTIIATAPTKPRRLELTRLHWGDSTASGECILGDEETTWLLEMKHLRLDEIWQTAAPFAESWSPLPASAYPPVAQAPAPASPTTGGRWKGHWSAEEITLGDDAPRMKAHGDLTGAGSRLTSVALTARAATATAEMHAAYGRGAPGHIEISVPDLAVLLAAIRAPLRARPPSPNGPLPLLAAHLERAHAMIGSGALAISGSLDEENSRFSGHIELRNAFLRDAPWLVKLVALKTGRKLHTRPFIERLMIEQLEISNDEIAVRNLNLKGSGLVDRFNIENGVYRTIDGSIEISGTYWGAGFEIVGPRNRRQFYLKENALIRAVGTDADADFDPQ